MVARDSFAEFLRAQLAPIGRVTIIGGAAFSGVPTNKPSRGITITRPSGDACIPVADRPPSNRGKIRLTRSCKLPRLEVTFRAGLRGREGAAPRQSCVYGA
jgi:hypothetical protein